MTMEEKTGKPSLWNQALKAVKGDSTKELVEQFTQEMTLVAEGLCEDQARLRTAVDGLLRESEGKAAKHQQDYENIIQQIDRQEKETKTRLDELSRRIAALEKPAAKPAKGKLRLGADLISRLTVLVGIVCGTWLIVTILGLFI